jgi:hypothetical protein
VWRQIGVLYQSASQSQEMLQRVEQQTAQHVGGSLQALSSMDKRVGQVFFFYQFINARYYLLNLFIIYTGD